jgi:hypothetical protein
MTIFCPIVIWLGLVILGLAAKIRATVTLNRAAMA